MSTISTTMETCNALTTLRGEILTDSGSSSEEEIDLVCPIPRCRKRFKSLAETRSYLTPLQNSILAI
ncbi:hypothetical protein PC128_g18415 [Phytophthora cactorum]|nr:hypothetical protein PC128_g18415 [Phytophthora cactorum]